MILWLKTFQYWLFGLVIAFLLSALGVQTVRLSSAKTDLALEQAARSAETAARAKAVADELTAQAEKKRVEQETIAQKDEEHENALRKQEMERVAIVADNARLRKQIATYAAGSRQTNETESAFTERLVNRSQVLGNLLAEGIDLSAEGRSIIERRDQEVTRLLDQIRIDRAACE